MSAVRTCPKQDRCGFPSTRRRGSPRTSHGRRGTDRPMRVAPASNPNPLAYAYLQAAERLGYHHDDLNGAAKNCARKPTWSAACSTGIETTGRSRCRPMTSANLAHQDALFGNPVQPHARHRGIDGQPEQLGGVDAVTAAQWLDPWPG
jgi:hypothetical protein